MVLTNDMFTFSFELMLTELCTAVGRRRRTNGDGLWTTPVRSRAAYTLGTHLVDFNGSSDKPVFAVQSGNGRIQTSDPVLFKLMRLSLVTKF